MAVGACLLFVLTACTKDCLRCVEVYGDEATIYLDDAGSSAEVREAILDADSKGVVSYTVIGSAAESDCHLTRLRIRESKALILSQ